MSQLKEREEGFLNEQGDGGGGGAGGGCLRPGDVAQSLGRVRSEHAYTHPRTHTDPNKCGHRYLELCSSGKISSAQFMLSRESPPLRVGGGVYSCFLSDLT